jgi:hypothetical protein
LREVWSKGRESEKRERIVVGEAYCLVEAFKEGFSEEKSRNGLSFYVAKRG